MLLKYKIGRQENWTSVEFPRGPSFLPDGSSCTLHLHTYNLSPDRAIPIAGLPPGEQVHYAGHFTIANPSDGTTEKWIISIVVQPPPPPEDNGQEQQAGAADIAVPPQQQGVVAEAQVDWVADFSGDTSIKLPGNLGTLFYRHWGRVRKGDGLRLTINSGQYDIPLEAQVPESVLQRMSSAAFWVLSVTLTYLRS